MIAADMEAGTESFGALKSMMASRGWGKFIPQNPAIHSRSTGIIGHIETL
ncbi:MULTISPECIES: hypothetical protein [Corynebacterium]|nr:MULTISPECIES: hypothetical protein [Corynebacterium]MDK4268131.1 hypothetical protein [Corynebacterium accolens]MDK8652940.1 hypothetical protein [Corynebacterium accolens]WKS57700.1 hypothetical protein NLL35_09390 [Corynebacterium accolens]